MTRHPGIRSLFGLVLAWAGPTAWAVLPLGIPLDTDQVSLSAFAAEVAVTVSPNATPFLVAQSLAEDGSGGAVEVEQGLAGISVKRSDTDRTLRLRFELSLRPGQRLLVQGEDLVIVLDGRAAPATPTDPSSAAAPTYELQLDRSQAHLSAVGPLLATGTGSWWRGDATVGPIQLGLMGGSAELHGHSGALRVTGDGAEVLAENVTGDVTAALSGGSFELRQGEGELSLEGKDTAFRLAAWAGASLVKADGSSFDAVDCGGESFELITTDTQLVVESQRGGLTSRLQGGSLTLSGMQGEARVEGRAEATVTVVDFAGALLLILESHAAAGVKNASGVVKARVDDGRLVAEGIERLELAASRSEVVGSAIRAFARGELADGFADLDLTGLTEGPRLVLIGKARAAVKLPTPCIVRASGAQSFDGNQLEVVGCDFSAPGQGARTGRNYAGRALVLAVSIDPTASLEVEGRSVN